MAVDTRDAVLGCVEVREMQGYLRPRELKDLPRCLVKPSTRDAAEHLEEEVANALGTCLCPPASLPSAPH